MKKTMAILFALTIASAIQAANTVSVTDTDTNDYTRTSGVAIDFDATTGLAADWTPDLTNGRMYRVDSVSLFLGEQGTTNENLYLGVYRTISTDTGGPDALSDFLGVSDNTINPSTAAVDTALTWTFATIAATATVNPRNNPGRGSEDTLYFVMQTGTAAMTDTGPEAADGQRPFRRIDGEDGAFANHLSAVIHASRPGATDLVSSRALEYEAQVTDIGEAPEEPPPAEPQDSAVSVTDDSGNNYGKTSGVAIDFDASTELTADWDPDLVAGSAYQVDSLSLFLGAQGLVDEDLYLGVYTGLDEQIGVTNAAALSGFLGVSDNTFNLSSADVDTALVWTFSGAAPQVVPESNPGSGGDILYFVLQTGTSALADTGSIQSDDRPFRRINTGGSFNDELSAVIHGSRNNNTTSPDLVLDRALEYEAQLSIAGLSYNAWISQFATGGLSARTDDVEPDGMNNELEYYLGGNPTLNDASVVLPGGVLAEAGGTNVFEYVYRRRTNDRNLSYDVFLKENLIIGPWISVSNTYEVATGSTEDPDIESVTNHFSVAEPLKFINLEITEE